MMKCYNVYMYPVHDVQKPWYMMLHIQQTHIIWVYSYTQFHVDGIYDTCNIRYGLSRTLTIRKSAVNVIHDVIQCYPRCRANIG